MNSSTKVASIPMVTPDDPHAVSDRELVDRARDGDRDAFGMLVEKYQRRVFGVAFGMVGNPDDAMDVAQEAFIRVHRYLGSFQGSSSFYTWLYRIVINLCVDHLRKRSHAPTLDYDDRILHDDIHSRQPSMRADPVQALGNKELGEQLERALSQLSPVHRAVLHLREVEGLSYQEMAKVMECSVGTIMSRLFHARRRMQSFMLEYLEGTKGTKG